MSTPVGKDQRTLVVASATALTGRHDLAWLYRLLDAAGPTLAHRELDAQYGATRVITGREVTRQRLVSELHDAATDTRCQAVDLVLMVHGEPDHLVLAAPGAAGVDEVAAVDLASDLAARADLAAKLRLCYSTACFGASHATPLVGAGFSTAIGAKAINANSATELPLLLHAWAAGTSIGNALRKADDPRLRKAEDFLAHVVGHFDNVDSKKVLKGDTAITIDSPVTAG
jgi:hypothetical protein